MNSDEINEVLPDTPKGTFWNLREDGNRHVVLSLCDKNFLGFRRVLEASYVWTGTGAYNATVNTLTPSRIRQAANNCFEKYALKNQTLKARTTILGNYRKRETE